MENTSCEADSVPVMMDKKNGCLKFMKDENPEMLHVLFIESVCEKIFILFLIR